MMWWRKALAVAHLAWVVARSWTRELLAPVLGYPRPPGPRAYQIYVFNEGDEPGFHRDLPVRFFDPGTWERDARELTGWTAFRVEVRYVFRHKKYRMVLHRGDVCTFPPYQEPQAPACRLPRGVLSARLQGALGTDIDHDVTARVMKYQGPKGDFHAGLGLRVGLFEMFPFDDHADNAARYTHLRVMDTTGRLIDLPYAPATRLALARA